MGRGGKVWPLLKHSHDPTLRAYLIERLGPGGVDPKVLLVRLEEEKEVSVKRAILLSLGGHGSDRLSQDQRQNLLPRLLQLYREDPDPGIHGAAEWLVRAWGASNELKKIDKGLATGKVEGKRQWYINRQGQTMMIISRPGEFWMGEGDEKHRRKIDRSFAIASKEVTVEQFLRKDLQQRRVVKSGRQYFAKLYTPTGDCPVTYVSWYDAVAYCNWLSEQEGIPKEQWCYEQQGQYAQEVPDYLKRTGYRLPTEAEWEYACRAGGDTGYSFGESADLLEKYGWFDKNSLGQSHPVGSLKSNDLGLFDMHGNGWEWCQDGFKGYPKGGDGKAHDDKEDVTPKDSRVWRGGSFSNLASHVRSAARNSSVPTYRFSYGGFRPSRTLPLGSFTALPPTPEGGRK